MNPEFTHPVSFPFEFAKQNRELPHASSSPFYHLADYPRRVMLVLHRGRGFSYWLFPDADSAAWQVANSARADRQWYFQIEADRPVFPFMDFDRKPSRHYTAVRFEAACRLITVLFGGFVNAYFARRVWIGTADDWRFYCATTDKKFSMHAHAQCVLFANASELQAVIASFLRWLQHCRDWAPTGQIATELFHDGKCILDGAVYTKRPFRLPYNRKTSNEQNFLLPLQPGATQDDDIRWGFIHPIETPAGMSALPTQADLRRVRSACANALRFDAFPAVWGDDARALLEQLLKRASANVLDAVPADSLELEVDLSDAAFRRRLLLYTAMECERMLLHDAILPDCAQLLSRAVERCRESVTEWATIKVCCVHTDDLCALQTLNTVEPFVASAHLFLLSANKTELDCGQISQCALMPIEELRRHSANVFLVPENAVTVDCMRIALNDPFS